MPSIHGDWFHSRTSSNLSELAAIQLLVESSTRTEFIGKRWGAGRKNPENRWLYDFSATAKLGDDSIEPSTMQTKIRNWMRLGFLVDDKFLPLKWTNMGFLWKSAVDEGRGQDANLLYELIIANALGTISFSEEHSKFDPFPQEKGLLLKFLINNIKSSTAEYLSKNELEILIDGNTSTRTTGKNYSYWIRDLSQSGLFKKDSEGGISIKNKYEFLIDGISNYKPSRTVPALFIKEHPLDKSSPFRKYLLKEFRKHGSTDLIKAVEAIAGQKRHIYLKKYKVKARRDHNWPLNVKNNYGYKCAIPNCDSQGKLFIEAAHIKPHREIDRLNDNKHRTDLENGVALCISCHKLFDGGLFTLNNDGEVLPSKFIYSSELVKDDKQVNVKRILESKNKKLKDSVSYKVNLEYANFHRENIFLGE